MCLPFGQDENGIECIIHKVDIFTDTLPGLLLKYDVSMKTMKSLNDFPGNNFKACMTLRFPQTKAKAAQLVAQRTAPTRSKAQMVAAVIDGVCRANPDVKCGKEEAKSYLEMNDWDVKIAIEEAVEDLAWEVPQKQQQPKAAT